MNSAMRFGRSMLCVACMGMFGVGALLATPSAAWSGGGEVSQEWDLSDTKQRGQACTAWFYAQEFDKILELGLTPAMEDAMPGIGGLDGFWEAVNTQLGAEREVLEETVSREQGFDVYLRTARFEKFGSDVLVQWAFDADGRIGGFGIRPKQ